MRCCLTCEFIALPLCRCSAHTIRKQTFFSLILQVLHIIQVQIRKMCREKKRTAPPFLRSHFFFSASRWSWTHYFLFQHRQFSALYFLFRRLGGIYGICTKIQPHMQLCMCVCGTRMNPDEFNEHFAQVVLVFN